MTPTPADPARLTVHTPEDLIALAPVVLGFAPEESVVLLTFGAHAPFHARVDLPPPQHLDDVIDLLLAPARVHRAERVALVTVATDVRRARAVTLEIADAFADAGIEVIEGLTTDGRAWWGLGDLDPAAEGTPYDVADHRFAAEAVFRGQVVRGSRAELAATLEPDPAAAAAVETRLRDPAPEPSPTDAAWALALVRRCLRGARQPDDAEVARLVRTLADDDVRDAQLWELDRRQAAAQVEWWSAITRRTPDPWSQHPAGLAGLAAWLGGDGALAWCAVDRARRVDPANGLADVLAAVLTAAVPPTDWDRHRGTPPLRLA